MIKILAIFWLIVFNNLLFSQSRGLVSIRIDDNPTTLYEKSYALLIGVSDYDNGLDSLPGVKKDLQLLEPVLKKQGFDVTVVSNPTKIELETAINEFIKNYGQKYENRLLIYFAGHGYTIKTNYNDVLGYIAPKNAPNPNTDLANFKSIAIPMSQIEVYAQNIDCKHVLFMFDACFSGSLFNIMRSPPEIISYKTTKPVRQFITSGSIDETVPDESIFRNEFISALTTSSADNNKDGYLTATELGEFLQTNVTNYSRNSQHPQYGKIRNPNLDKGDFVFILSDTTATEEIKQERPIKPPAEPSKKNEKTDVRIIYGGDVFGCRLPITIKIGNRTFNPSGNIFIATDIPLGKQHYSINGNIYCPNIGGCISNGEGEIVVKENSTFFITWENVEFSKCKIVLNEQ